MYFKKASVATANSDHLKSKDSFSAISTGESQTATDGSPEQNSSSLNTSSQGRAERVAMRSSFAVGVSSNLSLSNENLSFQIHDILTLNFTYHFEGKYLLWEVSLSIKYQDLISTCI